MEFDIFVEKTLSGLSKGKSVEDLAKMHNVSVGTIRKQLAMGIKVERKEHGKRAKHIAMDHLTERPDYYTMLSKAEKE